MKRIVRSAAIVAGVLATVAAASAHAGSGAARVSFGDDFFHPGQAGPVAVRAHGPEAIWAKKTGTTEDHNVREDSALFHSGPPGSFDTYKADVSAGTRRLDFGGGSPIEARPQETYQVRARSYSKSNPDRKSAWTPPVSFSVAGG